MYTWIEVVFCWGFLTWEGLPWYPCWTLPAWSYRCSFPTYLAFAAAAVAVYSPLLSLLPSGYISRGTLWHGSISYGFIAHHWPSSFADAARGAPDLSWSWRTAVGTETWIASLFPCSYFLASLWRYRGAVTGFDWTFSSWHDVRWIFAHLEHRRNFRSGLRLPLHSWWLL